MSDILITLPLREAVSLHAPRWARAAIIYWTPDHPEDEYLVGWAGGSRTTARHLRAAMKMHEYNHPLARRKTSREAVLSTVAWGEAAITTTSGNVQWAYPVSFTEVRELTSTQRPVRICESATRWRENGPRFVKPEEPAGRVYVTVRRNEERNGIELTFNRKPDDALRARLCEAGYRWSSFSKLWWKVAYEGDLEWANSLALEINAGVLTPL